MTDMQAAATPSPVPSPSGEEELRFIRNFHDVFLSIGLAMFAVGLGIVSSLVLKNLTAGIDEAEWRRVTMTVAGVLLIDAAIMWALAEVFARTRRLFLPAIVILLAFIGFWFGALAAIYALLFLDAGIESLDKGLGELKTLPLFLSAGVTAGIFAYYLRMRLPFAMGLGAASLAGTAVAALFWHDPKLIAQNYLGIELAAGVFLFALGVAFDARDPQRLTRYSDNAFWLHFFAAPLIFGSVIVMVAGEKGVFAGGTYPAMATLIVVVVFALVSLLINRRALLVSGLLSAAVAIGVLVSKTGLDGAWTAALTLLLLGGAMVLLGGGWHAVRRLLVAPFPKSGPISRIIPPEPARGSASE
ncbi:MAG: hypothetical protein VX640_10975 [Pseudomonadota bacterium]|nr:hypothetical protein [Pseudomonadota bacterium]